MLNTVNTTAYRKNDSPSFKNGMIVSKLASPVLTNGFKYLQSTPVAEIVGIDVGTMIVPRAVSDAKQNPIYGVETFFKELIPIIPNPFLPGIVAGALMAKSRYKGLYANSSTLNGLHEAWKKADPQKIFPIKEPNKVLSLAQKRQRFNIAQKYFEEIFLKTEGLVGTEYKHLREGSKLSKEGIKLTKKMAAITVGNNNNKTISKITKKLAKKFTFLTGAEENLRVNLGKNIGDSYTTNTRMHFRDAITAGKKLLIKIAPKELGKEVERVGNLSKNHTVQAIASAIIFGSSIQWLINKTSKLLTGKEGFSGYKDFTEKKALLNISKEEEKKIRKENTEKLIKGKILATVGMIGIMAATMGAFGKKGFLKNGGLKELGKRLEIKDKFAHMDVIRGVYGSILISRFWASRETSELKVDVAKNYLGYLNWLVLGPFVAKGIAHALNKSLVNVSEKFPKTKNPFKIVGHWLGSVAQKTPNETQAMINKEIAKAPTKLLKEKAIKAGKKILAIHNGSKIGGLAWSMLALGFGVPLFVNKFIIDKDREKQLETPKRPNIYSTDLNKTEEIPKVEEFKITKEVLYGSFSNRLISLKKQGA